MKKALIRLPVQGGFDGCKLRGQWVVILNKWDDQRGPEFGGNHHVVGDRDHLVIPVY